MKTILSIVIPCSAKHFQIVGRALQSVLEQVKKCISTKFKVFILLHPSSSIPEGLTSVINNCTSNLDITVVCSNINITNSLEEILCFPQIFESELVALLAADDFWIEVDLTNVIRNFQTDVSLCLLYLESYFHSSNSIARTSSDTIDLTSQDPETRVSNYISLPHDNSLFWGFYRSESLRHLLTSSFGINAPKIAWDWWFLSRVLRLGTTAKGPGKLIRDQTSGETYLIAQINEFGSSWAGVFAVSDSLLGILADSPENARHKHLPSFLNNLMAMYKMAIHSRKFQDIQQIINSHDVQAVLCKWLLDSIDSSKGRIDFLDRKNRMIAIADLENRLNQGCANK